MRLNLKAVKGLILFILALPSYLAYAADEYQIPKFNMHYGVTPLSKDIYFIHMTIFWICVGIGIVVFGAMLIALMYHRKSRGVKAAQFHENKTLEIFWAIVPFIILIAMAVPATIVLVRMNDYADSSLTIKITGYQWKWKYDYLDEGIGYYSNLSTSLEQINNKAPKNKWYLLEVDKPLVVPVNEKIRFVVTSNDVIHSWWVPALGIKRDAIPGFIHEAWAKIQKPGIYRGQCAELCGVNHGYMPIVVHAVTRPEFNKWVASQRQEKQQTQAAYKDKMDVAELMKIGKSSYNKYCAACHQENGMGIAPIYPALRADSVAVGKPISRHIRIVLNGVPGSAMQGFADQLTDVELAAIITYERNAWGNHTGDVVQPIDIKKEKAALTKKGDTTVNP
ncbi:MAG: cytochrome c oxidase subunit II [Pseudomonadota bacterium]